jgi:hypothetical protein
MDAMEKVEKKPYAPPELIEYGDLVDITGTGLDDGTDATFTGSVFTG